MAKKPKRTWAFSAPLERTTGDPAWSYVEFPHDVKELFGKRGSVRMKALINGVAADRALMPTKSGYHIIVLSGELRKQAGIKRLGDLVRVELWLDPEPDRIELPDDLAETLDFMPEMKAAWDRLKPGMKRSMCYWVSSGKTAPTRAKRIAELLRRFESGYFQVGQGPNAQPKRSAEKKKPR